MDPIAWIRLDVHHAEYWNPRASRMMTLFSQAKAAPARDFSRQLAWILRAAH